MSYTFDPDLFKPIELTVNPKSITFTYDHNHSNKLPEVKEVIFAPPATIVYWKDGSRTVVKCSDDDYFDEEIGFTLCFMKKILGNKGNFNTYIRNNIKNAKRYQRPIPLTETPTVKIPDIIPELAKKLDEVLMPHRHG